MRMPTKRRIGYLATALSLLAAYGTTTPARAEVSASPSFRLSGGVLSSFTSVDQDARSASLRLQPRQGPGFHGSASLPGRYTLQSGYLPLSSPPPTALRIDRLSGGPSLLRAQYSSPGLPAGTTVTLTCTPLGGGPSHAVSGTASPLVLTGLQDGQPYSCVLSGLAFTSAAVTATAGASVQPIPALTTWASIALAGLLAMSGLASRRRNAPTAAG